jgi:hypothetical protein
MLSSGGNDLRRHGIPCRRARHGRGDRHAACRSNGSSIGSELAERQRREDALPAILADVAGRHWRIDGT